METTYSVSSKYEHANRAPGLSSTSGIRDEDRARQLFEEERDRAVRVLAGPEGPGPEPPHTVRVSLWRHPDHAQPVPIIQFRSHRHPNDR